MRRTAMIAVLVALVTASAHAGVVLTYNMKQGEMLRYRCESEGSGIISATGQNGPLTMNSRFEYVMHCDEVDDAGNMTITSTVEDLQVEARWNGRDLPVDLTIPPVTTKIAPSGKVLATNVVHPEGGDDDAPTSMGGALAQRTQFDVGQFFGDFKSPGFPTEAVEPGSRWEETVNLNTQSGQPIVVQTTTSFLDYAKLNGVTCARMQTDYAMPLDLSLLAIAMLQMKGKHTGSQIAYFDYEGGKVLRFDGIGDTELTMQTPQLFGGGATNQTAVRMTLRSNTSVVLVTD